MRPDRLTAAQRRAVEHGLRDACVTASAGSGKTTVLTGRFVRLVRQHGLPPRRIAALTFTEKAASQMRRRIAEAFEEAGLEAERAEVEFAPISTIHAFCARLLRSHAVEAGVDPAFAVLDETEALLLREDAALLAERRLRAEGSPDPAVLARLGLGRSDVPRLLERVRTAGGRAAELAWAGPPADPARPAAAVREALPAYEAGARTLPAEWREPARRAAEAARAAVAATRADAGLAAAAEEAVAGVWPRSGRTRAWSDARTALRNGLAALEAALLDEVGAREVAPALARVLAAVEASYEERKREAGALDFADLEILTLRLLDRLAAAGRALPSAPAALLVDEVQDTSPLQARILARLAGPRCPRFSVGDPKQSIYRFRGADVRVITAERERVGAEGRLDLPETFRARGPLVDVLNALHARSFAGGAAGVPHEPMRAAGEFRDAEGPEVEVAVIADDASRTDDLRPREAAWVAAWVRDLVARGVPRARVEEGRAPRALCHGDVAILLRATGALKTYEDALAAADVPYLTWKGRGFFRAEEVSDLLHVLRVVHDPADRFALAAFATGPAVGAGDADLLRWFGGPEEPWALFARDEHPRVRAAAAAVEALRREALGGGLARVVQGALDALGLLEAALLQRDGERRAANLRKAVHAAREMERTGRHGLDDLLRRIALLTDRDVREAEAPLGGEGDDVVRLMTVHAAKGLEFPVVVLADAGHLPKSVSDAVLLDDAGRLAAKLADPFEGDPRRTAAWTRLQEAAGAAEREEARRLLYVASTRAEERLLVTTVRGSREPGGWAGTLREALELDAWEDVERRFGAGRLVARVVPAATVPLRSPPPGPAGEAPGPAAVARADALLAAADEPTAPLGGTRFVVSVSELLSFAASPARCREERLLPPRRGEAPRPAPRDPEDPDGGLPPDPEEARRRERLERWDEPDGREGDLDRAALGRAVHAILERWAPGGPGLDDLAARAVQEEFGEGLGAAAPAGAVAAARAMAERGLASPTGRRLAAALAAGEGALREVAFHARIRFPGGRTVGAFDALLVKGSIDLWLPDGGTWVVDHKTNPPGGRWRTPEDLARHYGWQLRLYALAAERILRQDVAGARLLLLDPGWGSEAAEVPVDVGGPALEEARRLCEAFAVAELEDRWPEDWRALLPAAGRPA